MFFEAVESKNDPTIFYWSDEDDNFKKAAASIFEILDQEIMVIEVAEHYCRENS